MASSEGIFKIQKGSGMDSIKKCIFAKGYMVAESVNHKK